MNRIQAMVEASKRFEPIFAETKRCPTCGEVKMLAEYPKGGGYDGHGWECSHCNGVRANAWNAQQSLERRKARQGVNWAVRSGKIPRIEHQVCDECGEAAQHRHHPDYAEPLNVAPMCRRCHKKLHKNMRANLDKT